MLVKVGGIPDVCQFSQIYGDHRQAEDSQGTGNILVM